MQLPIRPIILAVLFSLSLITGAFADSATYKIGIITPTLSASEDEFRGAVLVANKYPGKIKHLVLPENYSQEQETAITQILSLGDDPEIKAIVICAGYSGILPAIEKIKKKHPEMLVITAPIWDDPDMMAKYIDLSLDTDWVQRGISIPTKAKQMGAKTFIHYSFPTHMAKEVLAKRRDKMKETCGKLDMKFVEVSTPDPTTGAGRAPMLQFLQEDIPRQIAKYGKDTAVFGTNCPMQDVIIAKALELKFIMPEQCCPTPTQGFPAAMNLEITEKDAGNFAMINEQIKGKAAAAGVTGRLSTWPVAVGYFFPEFAAKLAMEKLEKRIASFEPAQIKPIAREIAGVDVAFSPMKPELNNYYLIIMDSIIY